MSTLRHHYSDSTKASSPGASYQLIRDHIWFRSGVNGIPLRTLYMLNCIPRSQSVDVRSNTLPNKARSPFAAQSVRREDEATQLFIDNVVAQISQLPNQPTSLPIRFITSFVQRCFPSDLVLVNFRQALTGLDYLKDLENRRQCEVGAAFSRRDDHRKTLDAHDYSRASQSPGVALGIKSTEQKAYTTEVLYTELYIGLRRWILINELSRIPFNKNNCVAMLNTLFPPQISTQPTSNYTLATLTDQKNLRDSLFKYIQSVEKSGPQALETLMQQGKATGDRNGWVAVAKTLDMYLQLANGIIRESAEVIDMQNVLHIGATRDPKTADASVSDNGSDGSCARAASNGEPASPVITPKSPFRETSRTTLNKIQHGLEAIGRSKTDVVEMVPEYARSARLLHKTKTIRKMKSIGRD